MFHKLKIVVLVFICLFLGSGCFNDPSSDQIVKLNDLNTWMQSNGKIKVLSTTAMIDALVGEIGKNRIDHLTLIQGDLDPHSFELVKGDDEKLAFAQVVFSNGLGLEHGASLAYQLSHHRHNIPLGEKIIRNNPSLEIRVDGQVDPHIWMDISLWSYGIDEIVAALSEIDPKASRFYLENGAELRHKMLQSHQEMLELLLTLPQEKRYLVTSHDAFHYFVRAYFAQPEERLNEAWRVRLAAPEGLAPDGQLSSMHIKAVIDYILEHHVVAVFPESNVSRDALKKIVSVCRSKDVSVKISDQVLYGDTMGQGELGAGTYLGMIRHNGDVIFKELSKDL